MLAESPAGVVSAVFVAVPLSHDEKNPEDTSKTDSTENHFFIRMLFFRKIIKNGAASVDRMLRDY